MQVEQLPLAAIAGVLHFNIIDVYSRFFLESWMSLPRLLDITYQSIIRHTTHCTAKSSLEPQNDMLLIPDIMILLHLKAALTISLGVTVLPTFRWVPGYELVVCFWLIPVSSFMFPRWCIVMRPFHLGSLGATSGLTCCCGQTLPWSYSCFL